MFPLTRFHLNCVLRGRRVVVGEEVRKVGLHTESSGEPAGLALCCIYQEFMPVNLSVPPGDISPQQGCGSAVGNRGTPRHPQQSPHQLQAEAACTPGARRWERGPSACSAASCLPH